jgi:hypothetical protein
MAGSHCLGTQSGQERRHMKAFGIILIGPDKGLSVYDKTFDDPGEALECGEVLRGEMKGFTVRPVPTDSVDYRRIWLKIKKRLDT